MKPEKRCHLTLMDRIDGFRISAVTVGTYIYQHLRVACGSTQFCTTLSEMPVCRYSVRPCLKKSDFTSHEQSNEERRGAKIGIFIFGLPSSTAFASFPNIC